MNSCPFCESRDLDVEVQDVVSVICKQCNAFGPTTKTKTGAENKWNRRVNPGCTECDKNKRKLVVAIDRIKEVELPWQKENNRLHTIIEDAKKLLQSTILHIANFTEQPAATRMRVATQKNFFEGVYVIIDKLGEKLKENHGLGGAPIGVPLKLDPESQKVLAKWADKELGLERE